MSADQPAATTPSYEQIMSAVAAAEAAPKNDAPIPQGWEDRLGELVDMVTSLDAPGCFEAPTMRAVQLARAVLVECHSAELVRPGIYPLFLGGVQLEWDQVEVRIPNGEPVSVDHACDTGLFDRALCPEPCGTMHVYCASCGERQDPCEHHAEEIRRG